MLSLTNVFEDGYVFQEKLIENCKKKVAKMLKDQNEGRANEISLPFNDNLRIN